MIPSQDISLYNALDSKLGSDGLGALLHLLEDTRNADMFREYLAASPIPISPRVVEEDWPTGSESKLRFLGQSGLYINDFTGPAYFREVGGTSKEPNYLNMIVKIRENMAPFENDIDQDEEPRLVIIDIGDGRDTFMYVEPDTMLHGDMSDMGDDCYFKPDSIVAIEGVHGIAGDEPAVHFKNDSKITKFREDIRPSWEEVQAWHERMNKKDAQF